MYRSQDIDIELFPIGLRFTLTSFQPISFSPSLRVELNQQSITRPHVAKNGRGAVELMIMAGVCGVCGKGEGGGASARLGSVFHVHRSMVLVTQI